MNKGKNYSKDFVEKHYDIYIGGKSLRETGLLAGCSEATIKHYFLKYGFVLKTRHQQIEAAKKTNMVKYGGNCPAQSPIGKIKTKKTLLDRYGVENIFQDEAIRAKIKASNLIKYGTENVSYNLDIVEKIRQKSICDAPNRDKKRKASNLEKYGMTHSQTSETKAKIKQTNIERYGFACALQNKEIRQKSKDTCLQKYGVDNPTKNEDIFKKAQKSNKKTTVAYHWKTGAEIICTASYELKVVDYLNSNLINFDWQPRGFELTINEKLYKYFPDLYLKDQDLYIEIKGWFRQEISKQKWDVFHGLYPNSELWNKEKLIQIGIL